jgi:hypothetical protein
MLPWAYIYQDGHPNFLWAWMLSGSVFRYLEGKMPPSGFAGMPSLAGIPSKLALNTDDPSARYLTGAWERPETNARWALAGGNSRMGTSARFILRAPDSALERARLKIVAWTPYERALSLTDHNGQELCRLAMTPDRYEYECEVKPDRIGLFLGKFTTPQRAVQRAPSELSPQRLAAITSVSIE